MFILEISLKCLQVREERLIVEDCSATSCNKYFVISYNENAICLICQNTIAVMKEYNIKRHYCTTHPAKFDGFEGQLWFDKIEQFKKSLSMQEMFHACKKDIGHVRELRFKILEVIQEKGKA